MTLQDRRGVPVSTPNRRALDRYEDAIELFHSYFNDPLAIIDEALAEDPDFVLGHCFRAGLMLSATDKAAEAALEHSVAAGEALWNRANERERGHILAGRAWAQGRFDRAVELYGAILADYPRDSLALQLAHLGDFYLGQSGQLRDRVARTLWAWDESVPGYGYVLGMHAFGLEEMGDYLRAEERGHQALALNRRDPWAIHAVAHVMEMQARLEDGIDWLTGRSQDWAHDNGFAFHNWWHLALYHFDLGDWDRVLAIYDRQIRPRPSEIALEMVDASALLWRLHLSGAPVGQRWQELADAWAGKAEDAYYAFNDAHAMMAFVGDGRDSAAAALLARLERRAREAGTNALLVAEVGLPLCRALHAFGHADYRAAVEILLPLRPIAHRFGGSHAQRDVLSLTLLEAAIRAGLGGTARGLASERMELKPRSPLASRFAARARELAGDHVGAAASEASTRAALLPKGQC
ncbi:MAG TPA: tetratricopeptide repeat protein [Candidatus Udaeobacter sp.]|nr:tetratricopeptide repeat protein [Candidatus Udaeobacter sp.]